MVSVALTRNKIAVIDVEDLPLVSKYKWSFDGRYAATYASVEGKIKKTYMHKMIVPYKMVDHINMDKLDNRKCNLRTTNQSLNSANACKKAKKNSYKGVYFVPKKHSDRHWESKIMVNRKNIWIGSFASEQDAVSAHIEASKKYFGDHARPS